MLVYRLFREVTLHSSGPVAETRDQLQNYIIHIYSGITSGRVLDGELLYTKILEVNLFRFAYRLFYEDFSPIYGALCVVAELT